MEKEDRIDRFNKEEQRSLGKYKNCIDFETTNYTDARSVGAEWLCKQTIDKLQLGGFLRKNGWTKNAVYTALSALIVRTVYIVSERSSYCYLRDDSAVSELHGGVSGWTPGINSLYKTTDKLYELREQLERYPYSVTDDIFNIDNKLILFDLINFYFEGSKRNSGKARLDRSKEKRSDCRLLVFTLCIDQEGFICYSSISEDNVADLKSLPSMINTLAKRNPSRIKDTSVIMDVGVATEENLELIKKKGYNYFCIPRTKMKDYTPSNDNENATVMGVCRQRIMLKEVKTENDEDYYLEITSPSEAMTESSMNRVWKERFEMELQRMNEGVSKRGGTKAYEKVVEHTGRVTQKYPSTAKFYQISYMKNKKKPKEMLRADWEIKDFSAVGSGHGVYSLRNSVRTLSERVTWEYYNLTREIERTNRQLRNDLNLCPIYHQKDERSDAHLFFDLLAHWMVDTIRCQLEREEESCYWTETVRRMSIQKLITTEEGNPLGETIEMRQRGSPSKQAKQIYDRLSLKHSSPKKNKTRRT